MATYFTPTAIPSQFHVSGDPAASYVLHAFSSGASTTPQTMYTNNAGTSAGTSITLDSEGYLATSGTRHPLWLDAAVNYRLELRESDDTTVVWQADSISVDSGAGAFDTPYLESTIATIKAESAYVAGDIIRTIEHTSGYGYEGGNLYQARAVTGGTDDNGSLIKSTGNTAIEFIALFPDGINDKQFGVARDGTTEDATPMQAGIDYAISVETDFHFTGGTSKISTQLTVDNTSIGLYGQGRYESTFDSFVTTSLFKFTRWGGKIDGIEVYINNSTGNFLEAGNVSRNCQISNIYAQVRNAYGAAATSSGIYLNSFDDTNGFSGGLEIRNVYCLLFKYGVRLRGPTPLGENTWTSVCIYNSWFLGRSAGIISGSAGIYMDEGSNGIGSCMYGGTIEGMDYPIYIKDGSYGGKFEMDIEGCNNPPFFGEDAGGGATATVGVPHRSMGAAGNGQYWYNNECLVGAGPVSESFYRTKYVLTSGNDPADGNTAWEAYHQASLIAGNPVVTHGRKFRVGVGQGGDNGPSVHPSDHYIELGRQRLHWGSQIPDSRTGNQIAGWKRGDVCFNMVAASGAPAAWSCVVTGICGDDGETGSISSGTAALTLDQAATGTVNGDAIRVVGAGAAGADLFTTISSGGGTTSLTLADNASTTVASARVYSPGTWAAWANL